MAEYTKVKNPASSFSVLRSKDVFFQHFQKSAMEYREGNTHDYQLRGLCAFPLMLPLSLILNVIGLLLRK